MMESEPSGSMEKAVNRRVGSSSDTPSLVKACVVEDVKRMQATAEGKNSCGKVMVQKADHRMSGRETEIENMKLKTCDGIPRSPGAPCHEILNCGTRPRLQGLILGWIATLRLLATITIGGTCTSCFLYFGYSTVDMH